jgi:hypothetical protein
VYAWLYQHGPATGGQIDQALTKHAHKRLPELRDQGVIEELREVECPVTGHNVILWDVTSELPKDYINKQSGRPSRKQLVEEIRQLRRENADLRQRNERLKAAARKYKAQAAQQSLPI